MINNSTIQPLEIAKQAALEAGKKALEIRNNSGMQIQSKSDNSQVTAGDFAADKIVKEIIKSHRPDDLILSEETCADWKDTDYLADNLWIIDPIDGTTNYVYGIPHSAVSIAYAQKGIVHAAVVYNFFIDELFYASKNAGAFLGDKGIDCNKTENLNHALVATGLPYLRPISEKCRQRLNSVADNCRDLRRLGAASLDLCFVACGRLDAYYEDVCSWDMAAGALIAREAGCSVGHTKYPADLKYPELDGNELLVSCPGIFEELKGLLTATFAAQK